MSQFSFSNPYENIITTNNSYNRNQIIDNNYQTNNDYQLDSYSYEISTNNYKLGTNINQNNVNNYNIIDNSSQINNNIYDSNENNLQIEGNNYIINNNNISFLENNNIFQNNYNEPTNFNNYQNYSNSPIINEEIPYPIQTLEIQDIQSIHQKNEQTSHINNTIENQIIIPEENNYLLNDEYIQPVGDNILDLNNNNSQNNINISNDNNNLNIEQKSDNNNTKEIKGEKISLIDVNKDYTIEQYSDIFKKILGNKNIENKELEDTIVKIIEKTEYVQRQQIRENFYRIYNDNLILKLKKEINGNFKESVLGSFLYPSEYDTYSINSAFKNNNQKKESILSEIIGSRSVTELQTIKKLYRSNYRKLLRKDIISETYGDFQKFLLSLLQCQRSTSSNPNTNSCANDASDLYRAGEKRRPNDEDTFIRIFTKSSPVELAIINHFYKQQTGKGLLGGIKSEFEFGKETKDLLDTIVRVLIDKNGFYAKAIKDAITEGNDAKLIRIICSRYTVDLNEIKEAYKRDYQKELVEDIKDKKEENWGKVIYSLCEKA